LNATLLSLTRSLRTSEKSGVKSLSFKVSAKAARLIGRESVASADGALSELIKNSYDADAKNCFVCFLPRYHSVPPQMSKSEFLWLAARYPEIELLFKPANAKGICELVGDLDKNQQAFVQNVITELMDLWIVDNGEGMSSEVIEKHWMVIGTNFKEDNITSKGGRTRSGAKGIGRFALDRLGTKCDLFSVHKPNPNTQSTTSLHWSVDWDAFDGTGKILDQVVAELTDDAKLISKALTEFAQQISSFAFDSEAAAGLANGETGTAIRISTLRDDWERDDLDNLSKFLGSLVPPNRQREFKIDLLDGREPNRYGEVHSTVLDDFDYRMIARVTSNGLIKFEIYRNELEKQRIDVGLFERPEMSDPQFDEASFQSEPVSYEKSFNELWPGQDSAFYEKLTSAGPFEFELYFFKRGMPGRDDAKRYPYRQFQPNPRKDWLELFGGIRIYRDNFAVRPYGEPNSRAYDWLNLGPRAASNPAAVSRKNWNVRPQNLAGTLTISRIANPQLADQSNREGIIQNKAFESLRIIALKIISEFELDRSTIHHNMNELYKAKNKDEQAKSEGAEAAKRVSEDPSKATQKDAVTLAKAYVAQADEIRELRDEQTMLRALATLGTVLVSFSHEMGQLQDTMGSRSASLADILTSYISPDDVFDVSTPFHPYRILEEWEADDQKIRQWFSFALSTINADKRRRKWINLEEHLDKIQENWKGFLKPRGIEIGAHFQIGFDPEILAFEIDLDSIFSNLILNSIEAFVNTTKGGTRRIDIRVERGPQNEAIIQYSDSGPGLSPDLKDPESIFRFAVTTKMDRKGNATGTGLGMWILSTVVGAYKGTATILKKNNLGGFGMLITLPAREGTSG